MDWPATRERRLWAAVAAFVAAIYGGTCVARPPLRVLEHLGVERIVTGGLVVLAAGVALAWLLRHRPDPREAVLTAATGIVYLSLLPWMAFPGEKLHLLEYGVLAALLLAALRERWGDGSAAPAAAIALTGILGWGDEVLQYFLPDRVYDLRDVAFNALSGAVVVAFLTVRRRLRAAAGTA